MSDGCMKSSPVDGAPAWFAGCAQPGRVLWVRDQLDKLGAVEEAYVPTVTQTRVIYGRKVDDERPISGWGNYFFVRMVLDAAGEWGAARRLPGVVGLLPVHNTRPLRVADRLVEVIRDRVQAGEFTPRELVSMFRRWLAGEQVDVVKGHLAEAEFPVQGIVLAQRGKRVRVQLSCGMGEKVVILPADQLAPSGSSGRRTHGGTHRRRARTRAIYPARAAAS